MRVRKQSTSAVLALLLLLPLTGSAVAHDGPDHGQHDAVDGPAEHEGKEQHGEDGGHLPASSRNVSLLGRIDLTSVPGGIADVAAWGNYAYLNTFSPECAGRPGAQGSGIHVVDISNPAAPVKVNFLPVEANSYPGEGVHVIDFEGRQYLLHNNETCDGSLPVTSGFGLWDVTTPPAATKIGQFGDTTPAIARQAFHTTHSVQGFVWQGRAYAVAQDNNEAADVDIFDLTPAIRGTGPAVLVWEGGIADWPGAHAPLANGDSIFHHDMQQKVIDGHNYLLVSYWDAGQILLNIDNPAAPVFLGDSDFPSPDLAGFAVPEGNSHQSYWSEDGRYVLSSDEDFSPTRTLCRITDGPHAGDTACGQFGWTLQLPPGGFAGRTVFGGSGCTTDQNGNGQPDRGELAPASVTGATVAVFSRGACFFSDKVRTAEEAGYQMAVIGQSHSGARQGLVPDSFLCGGQGSPVLETAYGTCIGHRAMHLLFDDAPEYPAAPEGYAAGGDLPAINTLGASISARGGVFDGWGYIRLHDATNPNLPEIGAYAVPESLDPAFASGFGNLTVHEVKTDPRRKANLAYASYYDAGLRVLSFGPNGLREVGHYIAPGGNDFWGVVPHCVGQCLLNPNDAGRGRDNAKRPLLLMSDRDSGLWILRYTGKE